MWPLLQKMHGISVRQLFVHPFVKTVAVRIKAHSFCRQTERGCETDVKDYKMAQQTSTLTTKETMTTVVLREKMKNSECRLLKITQI